MPIARLALDGLQSTINDMDTQKFPTVWELFSIDLVTAPRNDIVNGMNYVTQANQSRKPESAPAEESAREKPRLGDDSQAFIGSKLREFYDDVVAEPVPDRFVELLKKLGDDEKASK
ncbi:NepR family anti-sigma factor [Pelagibacterium xiamenense]|uniref:NepR family anti-sigma factor n=1 Tax=Pelagibacterium xiamenense TaxID=2901140 RepID=UPI001E2C56ED|nr:NepR family anti-sigma factor [Pelagibacterium xiamenense]MCD7060174.1 hypothetical protein [Pelagibacterium xiamenense]